MIAMTANATAIAKTVSKRNVSSGGAKNVRCVAKRPLADGH
jgi:hypothetical protein